MDLSEPALGSALRRSRAASMPARPGICPNQPSLRPSPQPHRCCRPGFPNPRSAPSFVATASVPCRRARDLSEHALPRIFSHRPAPAVARCTLQSRHSPRHLAGHGPPEPPRLPRQPRHHAARPAGARRHAALVGGELRQPAQRRARDGPGGRGGGGGGARAGGGAGRRGGARDRLHLRRDGGEQHRHQGRRALRGVAGRRRRRRIVTARHRAQMRPRMRARPGRRGLRAGAAAGRAGRPAGPRHAAGRAGGGADPAGLRHGGEQRDRRGAGPRRDRRPGEGGGRAVPHRRGAGRRARAARRGGDRASTCSPCPATRSTGRRGSARSMCAGGRGCAWLPLFSGGGQERGLALRHPAGAARRRLRRGGAAGGGGDGAGCGPRRRAARPVHGGARRRGAGRAVERPSGTARARATST